MSEIKNSDQRDHETERSKRSQRSQRPRDRRDRRDHETEGDQETKVRLGIIVCPRLCFGPNGLLGPNGPKKIETQETERPRDQSEFEYRHCPRLRFGLYGLLGPYGPPKKIETNSPQRKQRPSSPFALTKNSS